MKDFLIIIMFLLIGGGWFVFVGHSHATKLKYECRVAYPWYDAFFLDTDHCPGDSAPQS
ncbi:hypothetical protein [Thiorhodovibrio frisius]|uniref:Uncharacterized protein n=1 Tax=Thiorhodovibrio frisius TaxID=631362 RepID=H8YXJ6_9GAMM|nr:hypothetical protein [Thiorhodovibrio frisius]EIC23172.1 hypothetical protein Thi970DRAFT_00825 [Thiorhodovibrio frisius]WPL22557.1 hypothetical protein Thiofri_02724 [Thiorhodovibrio frisius]